MTNFGERIYNLRNRNNMSQGDLADRLDVSRQTISKWENNMCLPEAEKLLQLSEIFGVSVDYILKGKTIVEPEPVYICVKDPDSENNSKYNENVIRKYVGIILALLCGFLTLVCAVAESIFVLGAAPLTVLGILMACNVKHPWLTVSWIVYILSMIALSFLTAISPLSIFDRIVYEKDYLVILLWVYAEWITLAILILCTIKAKRGYIFKKKDKTE